MCYQLHYPMDLQNQEQINIRLPLVALISKSCASKPPELKKKQSHRLRRLKHLYQQFLYCIFSNRKRKSQELFGDTP